MYRADALTVCGNATGPADFGEGAVGDVAVIGGGA